MKIITYSYLHNIILSWNLNCNSKFHITSTVDRIILYLHIIFTQCDTYETPTLFKGILHILFYLNLENICCMFLKKNVDTPPRSTTIALSLYFFVTEIYVIHSASQYIYKVKTVITYKVINWACSFPFFPS